MLRQQWAWDTEGEPVGNGDQTQREVQETEAAMSEQHGADSLAGLAM